MRYISLLPSVVIVNGKSKSAVFNMDAGKYDSIPSSWGLFLTSVSQQRSIAIDIFTEEALLYSIDPLEMREFLLFNNLAIESDFSIPFQNTTLSNWDIPFEFESLIVDANTENDSLKFIELLPNFRLSRFTQVRLFFKSSLLHLRQVIAKLVAKGYFNIEFIVNYSNNEQLSNYLKLLDDYPFHLSKIILMGAERDEMCGKRMVLNKKVLSNCSACGIISEILLSINIETYAKYLRGNTCLWKKISVSSNGDVKHCPSMSFSYGRLGEIDFLDVKKDSRYKLFSEIKKSEIPICCDCEYRVFCTDCRCYIVNPLDIYSKPRKCRYSPY